MQVSNFGYDKNKDDFYILSILSEFSLGMQHFTFDNDCLLLEDDDRVFKLVQSNMYDGTSPLYVYNYEDTYIAVIHATENGEDDGEHDDYHSYIVTFTLDKLADTFCEIYRLMR